ncbi:hypothetical protein [Effusibacillus lacus]|nr:hypothetical protein [Effusibacillus lacus]
MDILALLYSLLVTVLVVWTLFLGYQMFLTQQALSEVARRGILMMEMAGGLTVDIQNRLAEDLVARGLERTQITGTPAPVAFRGDIQLRLQYPYRFFGTSISPFEIEVPLGGIRNSISLKNPR